MSAHLQVLPHTKPQQIPFYSEEYLATSAHAFAEAWEFDLATAHHPNHERFPDPVDAYAFCFVEPVSRAQAQKLQDLTIAACQAHKAGLELPCPLEAWSTHNDLPQTVVDRARAAGVHPHLQVFADRMSDDSALENRITGERLSKDDLLYPQCERNIPWLLVGLVVVACVLAFLVLSQQLPLLDIRP